MQGVAVCRAGLAATFSEADLKKKLDEPDCEIRLAILRREAWHAGSEVRAVECRGVVDLAGEEAFPKRTERDEADAEFLERRQDLALGLAPPQGVFALQRRDRQDGVRAADRLRTSLGQTEVLHFALADQIPDGFILRYPTEGSSEGVDGLPGDEGAFLACSFWMADDLAMIGRVDEARKLFEKLLSLRNDLGLLAEEWDPRLQRQVGNFPQAFSHVPLIDTALRLTASGAYGG